VYDFSTSDSTNINNDLSFGGENVIRMRDYPEIQGLLAKDGEKVSLKDI